MMAPSSLSCTLMDLRFLNTFNYKLLFIFRWVHMFSEYFLNIASSGFLSVCSADGLLDVPELSVTTISKVVDCDCGVVVHTVLLCP